MYLCTQPKAYIFVPDALDFQDIVVQHSLLPLQDIDIYQGNKSFEKAKTEVKDFLSKLLVLTESEKEYVREFNDKKYIPELLFEDKEMVNRIKFHPMALWKTRSR